MKLVVGEWIEIKKKTYAFFAENSKKTSRPLAIIFNNTEGGCYIYSIDYNRYISQGEVKANSLDEAKNEVVSILQNRSPEKYVPLYYDLEYYVLVFDKNEIKVDNNHIQACPPERFREGRIQELKNRSGVIEIWQCHGGILAEMIKTVLYREDDNITTIYDAVKYSGRLLL